MTGIILTHVRHMRNRLTRKFVKTINKEKRDYNELVEMALLNKLKKLKRYARDLNTIGYDVTISLDNGIDESDFELIIRKRSTTRNH